MTTVSARADRFRGSLLALALADAVGAYHEGGPGERLLWRILGIGKGRLLRYTDDTQMAVVLAESLVAHGGVDADLLARDWAEACAWRRGYGAGALRVLRLVKRGTPWRDASRAVFPDGSFGNGAAMRAAPLGLFHARDLERLVAETRLASSITHAHPLGVEGALLIARGTALALANAFSWDAVEEAASETAFLDRIRAARALDAAGPKTVAKTLGNGVRADGSVVTALLAFHRHRERRFEELLEFVVAVGGDTDTIGAMAGGMWGALRGVSALPSDLLARLEDRTRIEAAAEGLFSARARGPRT